MSHKSQSSERKSHESEYKEEIKNPGLDVLSLSRAVKARKSEYTGRRSIRVNVGTWNVAALSGTEKDIERWFVSGQGVCEKFSGTKGVRSEPQTPGTHSEPKSAGDKTTPSDYSPEDIDLYVLGLQEVVDISSPAEALRPYVDHGPSQRWKEAVGKALPSRYELVSEVQLIGLLLLIYASPSIASGISHISSTSVGTGLMGYMGNKGAVATRLVLGETTRLVFINSHLSAGSDKSSLERRNWDSSQIVQRAKFEPISFENENDASEESGESIGDEDFTFWFGDLNYRLEDIPGEDVRQVLARHTANTHDKEGHAKLKSDPCGVSGDATVDSCEDSPPPSVEDETDSHTDEESDPHNDPASLQTTISSLLPHDQLRLQQTKGAAFHKGWREGGISFLPTYKYDVGSVAMFDSSEKQRGPSWCDRILFRTHQDKVRHERLDREAEEARKRDREMKASGLDKAVADDLVLFEYNPDTDGAESDYSADQDRSGDESDASTVASQDLSHDPIRLENYVSYQGIVSSDHKPLSATFTLSFDAVNPELKAKIHQEVARELDRAENEARPNITVVVDRHGEQPVSSEDDDGLEFGDVAFDVPVHRSLTIANTSGTAATFSFAKRNHDADDTIAEAPSWLAVNVSKSPNAAAEEDRPTSSSTPGRHTLQPGEVANVDVTAHVKNIHHIRLLNAGKLKLEDILVLHVDGGRDHFVSVHGKWLPTCFGCSIEELTRMPEGGARSLTESHTPGSFGTEGPVRLSAPRELFRLTEVISELTERAIAEWSMTNGEDDEHHAPWTESSAGAWPFQPETWTLKDPQERASLRASVHEALDTNSSFDTIFAPEVSSLHRLEILCETLLAFLNALEDGIVTAKVWHDMEQQIIAREKAKSPPRTWEETQAWVLEHLAYSPAHSVSFTFVTFMLARIANEVAPVSSTRSQTLSSESGAGTPSDTQNPANKQQKSENIDPSHPPTPVSATTFITSGSFRRKHRHTGSSTSIPDTAQNPSLLRRQEVETALASIFSRVLISANAPLPLKDKERRVAEERRRSIIEPFLKMIGVDDRGPSGGRS
ncbi:hypothetical protein N7535_002933 [Penicillium sp. DV-2018c]|nr:hypothetical protein N7535_002933 [Penicillium sp. DV-2018c]